MQNKSWLTNVILFENESKTIRETLKAAIDARADIRNAFLRGADLRKADLRNADLTGADLRGAFLKNADLTGADLRKADLTGADLRKADLTGADLRKAFLTGADLRKANGLPSGVTIEKLDSKILAAIDAGGTLEMHSWHKCETTHCRAGWAITLAGEPGKKLESETSSYLAGWLIYKASYPDREPPSFFATNQEALADIRKNAEAESKT